MYYNFRRMSESNVWKALFWEVVVLTRGCIILGIHSVVNLNLI